MKLLAILIVIFCLLSDATAQEFNLPIGFNDLNSFHNQFRRQLSSQQHILTDVQQHHTQPRQAPQQNVFLQQTPSVEVSIKTQQQKNRSPASNNVRQNTLQHNNQFPRSMPLHTPLPQQQQQQQQLNPDLHTQNFLTLRNFANQQLGPQQSLPQRSFSNKPFQAQPQQQYSTQSPTVYQQQPYQNFAQASSQTQENLPNTNFKSYNQKPFSPISNFDYQQKLPLKHQEQNFQLTPNLGIPVPQIFPHLQSLQYQQQQRQHQLPLNTQPQQSFPSIPKPLAQTAEQEYKQKLIQKHEQFVQKQYEKSQNKVRQQHEEFLAKQEAIKQQVFSTNTGNPQQNVQTNYNIQRGRPVSSAELPLFSSALQKYNQEHPTTTTTTSTTEPTPTPGKPVKDIYTQVKAELGKYGQKISADGIGKSVKTISRDELLKQLKAALAEAAPKEHGNKTYDEMDIVLPNGERVQVIRTTDPNLVKGQQTISQDQLQNLLAQQGGKLSLADVAPEKSKDITLPNGSKVQILRSPEPQVASDQQSLPGGFDISNLASLYGSDIAGISNGANSIASSAVIQSDSDSPPTLEELAKQGLIPEGYEIEGLSSTKPQNKPALTGSPKKKATYVYLEEQVDGSFKIQGVKANGEKETKQTGTEVENILDRIRSGDIKLPPSVQRLTLPNEETVEIHNGNIIKTTPIPAITTTTVKTTISPRIDSQHHTSYYTSTTTTPFKSRSSHNPSTNVYRTTTTHLPLTESLATVEKHHFGDTLVQSTEQNENASELEKTSSSNPSDDLIQILKSNELFAMAKYLRQSGLDNILNETGPYTIFVPTDKAFKNLLVQLGGPERAEEKFKANPRLLSGLLLHHVIPGAFEIATLQDEMTGISLAGTQLRVNQYTMHDQEWNDVTLTTINGAMVVLDKKDIHIPQGIAHAVDRVMFPLPVGDLLQTLQSDRENRFTSFLKVLYTSGLTEKLQSKGVKTYSVFAPTDKGFTEIESDTLEKLYNDKQAAEEFVMKHIVAGTLFSAGMRFYQVKDSLLTGKTVVLQKTSAGKIKVNDTQMVTSNIPATNGVIHAIDGVLS